VCSDRQVMGFSRKIPAKKPSNTFLCIPSHSHLFPQKESDILAFRAKPLILCGPAKGIYQAHNLKVAGSNPAPATNKIKGLAITG